MNLVVLFQNVGGYHGARLRALQNICNARNWKLTAVQVTDNCTEHQWGGLEQAIDFDLRTLLPSEGKPLDVDCGEGALAAARAMRIFLNKLRPDIVVIPGWGFPVSRTALSWSRRYGALAILMSESKRDDEKRLWWKDLIKSRLFVRRFDAALVGGQLHFDYLVELGFPVEQIFFGYDVVDNDYFRARAAAARADPGEARRRNPLLPVRPFFLAVTRLIDRKNILGLVEAFAAYRQHFKEDGAWDLAICGSGKEEPRIRQMIQHLELGDSVHMPGFVSYQQIGDWYGLADAFVHPALQEQWGLVVNEACAAGLPILSSQTVGARYDLVRENENGWLFNPRSKEEITSVLIKMHTSDRSKRNMMGKNSEAIVAAFCPQRFATSLFRAIEAARGSRKRRRSAVAAGEESGFAR